MEMRVFCFADYVEGVDDLSDDLANQASVAIDHSNL